MNDYTHLSATQCAHELEKKELLLAEREKENAPLKKHIEHLEDMIRLLKAGSA